MQMGVEEPDHENPFLIKVQTHQKGSSLRFRHRCPMAARIGCCKSLIWGYRQGMALTS